MSFNNRFTLTTMPRAAVGEMLNEWRHRRNQSQLDLSVGVGVSARHLSFVETGRSRPSPELVLAIAEELRVPLRERNAMLLAAGYAPRYGQTDLDDESMRRIRSSLQMMLDRHNPYPGVVIDRQWNVMLANETARMLTQDLPAHVLEPRLNVFRICLHPDGLASHTINFDDWASYLLGQIRRSIQLTGDAGLEAILEEISGYPNLSDLSQPGDLAIDDEPLPLIPFKLDIGPAVLSMFTTLTTFGTPRDVTLEELMVELFFPADDTTELLLTQRRDDGD